MAFITRVDTVVLCGAGAVVGGWKPVLDALGVDDPELGNVRMAALVSQLRAAVHLVAIEEAEIRSGKKQPSMTMSDGRGIGIHALEHRLEEYTTLRKAIEANLVAAKKAGTLRLRAQFAPYMERFVAGETVFITTNWDACVEDWERIRWPGRLGTQAIHGSIDSIATLVPGGECIDSLLLPSEMRHEGYRNEAGSTHIGTEQFISGGRLGMATRLVIYGLSLSPLDAELALMVANATKVSELIIVDRDPARVFAVLRAIMINRAPRPVSVQLVFADDDHAAELITTSELGGATRAVFPDSELEKLAHALWRRRGCPTDDSWADWFAAKRLARSAS